MECIVYIFFIYIFTLQSLSTWCVRECCRLCRWRGRVEQWCLQRRGVLGAVCSLNIMASWCSGQHAANCTGALAGSGFDSGRWQFMPHAYSEAWRLWLRLSTDLALIDSDYPYMVCYNSHVTRYLRCIKRTEAARRARRSEQNRSSPRAEGPVSTTMSFLTILNTDPFVANRRS